MNKMILAGDIGGTKTHLALFLEQEKRKWEASHIFKSGDYSTLTEIVQKFLAAHPECQIEKACFGIAGPVQNGKCKATNLPWMVDATLVVKETGISSVSLINDLEANAYGLPCLKEEEFFILNPGKKNEGNAALIAAGTGLGEAGLYWDKKKYHPFACEGGHCSFAPENELERGNRRFFYGIASSYDVASSP